jgi:hypothetical protein
VTRQSPSFALFLLALLPACSSESGKTAAAVGRAPVEALAPQAGRSGEQSSAIRHVAVRQFLTLELDPGQVETALKDTVARCVLPQCEVLETSLVRDARDAPPRALLRLRIIPSASAALLDELARRGDVIERRTESEDKTDAVIDVDARIKNMVELRDRLRKLLSSPGASVKDLVELEAQLARVQSDLDSANGRRKALGEETEKVTITVNLHSRRSATEASALEPVRHALLAAGRTFSQSVAGLVTFVIALVPWLLLLVPITWAWRRWRRGRAKA